MKTQIVKRNQIEKTRIVHLHLMAKLGDGLTSKGSLLGQLDLGTQQVDPVQAANVVVLLGSQ